MNITQKRANEVYNLIKSKGNFVKNIKLTKKINQEVFIMDKVEYTFNFINGSLIKIEEYSNKNFIEVYIK